MNVQSVEKAMRILDVLLAKRSPMTLTQISETCGFPKSTTHALISTLREFDMIEQDSDGRYALGIHLYELGCASAASWDISSLVHSYLEKLSDDTGATSFVAVLDRGQAMTFDRCVASAGLQIVSDQGSRFPLHATAQGKVLLSGLSDREVEHYARTHVLSQYTPHTITDPDALIREIQKVREQGYAIEDGEYRIGFRAVASPIRDHSGNVRYALGTLGIFRKVSTAEFAHAIERTLEYGNLISMELSRKMVR